MNLTERTRLQVQVAEVTFLCRVAGQDRARSSSILKEPRVELLLLRAKKNQMRWLGLLVRPPRHLPGEVFRARPTGRRPQDTMEGPCLSAKQGTPRNSPRRVG